MPFLNPLALILSFADSFVPLFVDANPVPDKIRREAPKPSDYPIGIKCPNEWQYPNFDLEDETDKAHLEQLHEVVCGYDIAVLITSALDEVSKASEIYKRYFYKVDDEDDCQSKIKSVCQRLYPENSGTNLGELVTRFVVDNNDFLVIDEDRDGDVTACEYMPEGDDVPALAYTHLDENDNREKIRFCDPSYTRPDVYHMGCDSFDTYPSTKWDSLSCIAMHEMFHYSSVGPKSEAEDGIIDARNDDNVGAYNLERCHNLVDPEDQPAKTEVNTDSYHRLQTDCRQSSKSLSNSCI